MNTSKTSSTDDNAAVSGNNTGTPPIETQPRTAPAESTPQTSETVFESSEIAGMHERQEALEIDRREQERAAKERELADRD